MRILILLSTYNGTRFMREQIDSLFNLDNIKDIDILVRDDGSKDGTQDVLNEYQKNHSNFKWYQGENCGATKSFWHLVLECDDKHDYYVFADQDDVWDKDKISVAINMLEKHDKSIPLLYFSDVRTVDKDLNPISDTMIEKGIPFNYPHSLIKNICPGCTYVFNRAARNLATRFDAIKYNTHHHDWAMYNIVSCFGEIIFDEVPHISYRQHGDNEVGANRKGLKKIIEKIKISDDPSFVNRRQKNALALEETYGKDMSEENYRLTHMLAHYKEDKKLKKAILKEPAFKSKGIQYLYFKHRIRVGKF